MFSIGFVARETGISPATLRKWEERYGFPKPTRENGHTRTYSEEELEYLREVKRLIDQGIRPSKLLGRKELFTAWLNKDTQTSQKNAFIDAMLELIITHDMKKLRLSLEKKLKKVGIYRFIEDVAAPLTVMVGDYWATSKISVFTEHCYSQQMYSLLNSFIKTMPPINNTPRILLTTLPDEKHTLGLVMIQALLFNQGACCINLGAELPLSECVKAVQHYQINIIGISFSAAFPKRMILPALKKLHADLPPDVSLWIGGTGVNQLNNLPMDVQLFTSATEVVAAYHAYQQRFKLAMD